MANPARDEVLADPGAFTVDDVTDVLQGATPEETEQVKALEAAGKQRRTILEYQPPQPKVEEPRYARARIFDPTEGPMIVGHVDGLGRTAKHPDIVGALADDDRETLTRDEVRQAIQEFLTRPLQEA